MSITRDFKLSLVAGRSVPLVINTNQYDEGEIWRFTLLDENGQKYSPSTGSIIGLKSDGHIIANAGTVSSTGLVIISETEQMTASPGKNFYELLIDDDTHGTANFIVFVEPRPGADGTPSDSDLAVFQEAIDAAAQIGDASELVDDVAVLKSRMDEFARLPDGSLSTAADAELVDIRVGADGTTYPTAGDAVRGQYSDLKNALDPLMDTIESTNVFNPVSTRVYPESGTAVINTDKSITINNVPRLSTVWIYAQGDTAITLEAGEYTLCIDEGLFVYGTNTVSFQHNGGGSYADIVTATGLQTAFTVPNDITAKFRIQYVATGSDYITNWSGHIWINKGEAQEYMPVGAVVQETKEFVEKDQGEINSGKLLAVGADGNVTLIDNNIDSIVTDEIYEKGNLINYDEVTKGYIKADGSVQSYNTLWCSGFCEVKQGNIYCNAVSGSININQYFAFYDENKDFLASYQTIGSMQRLTSDIRYLTVPEGAKYFRCTFSVDQSVNRNAWLSNKPENPYNTDSYNVNDVYPYTVNPVNPCDYSELTVRSFSKVVCIGDSLTYGGFNLSNEGSATGETQSSAELALRYSYPSNFQKITGIETVNKGDSGETSVSWYQQHQNDDFSQFDLAIIHLGVNDSAFSVSDADTLTAMENIVTMLNNARSDMRIAICSVIPAYDTSGYQAKGQLILNWAKGLNNPNIIPLDIARYSHVRPRTSYVAGHLTALGYYMMAYDIARYISWYMDNNKRDFRFIQFIGSSDAVYDYD